MGAKNAKTRSSGKRSRRSVAAGGRSSGVEAVRLRMASSMSYLGWSTA